MEKIIRLSIENTTKIRHVEDSYCELYSHDKNNGAFEFEISKGTLTNENVVALFKFLRSGSYWKTTGTVEDNKIKFNFDTSLITQNEEVVCYIYLDKEERNSDIFRFKFKVNLSEIDKASQLPVKERFFANSMIVDRVDVLTKEDFDKAIKEIEKGSKFLTEAQANEKYALKSDIPNITNLATTTELEKRALKTEIPNSETIVNKAVEKVEKKGYLTQHQSLAGYVTETQLTEKGYLTKHQDISGLATKRAVDDVAAKVTQLENRPVTSSYDDTEIKRKLKELEDRPTTANIDTSNFVTTTQLEDKHYLTEHQPLTDYATKEELRKAFLDEENHEKYAKKTELPIDYVSNSKLEELKTQLTIDTSNFATKQELQAISGSQLNVDNLVTKDELNSKGYLTQHQDISNLATKDELREVSNRQVTVDTSNLVTKSELEDKHYLTEHQSLVDYVTKTELRDKGYLEEHQSLTHITDRLKALEDRPLGNENVDTSDFVRNRVYQSDKEIFNTQLNRKLDRDETPFTLAIYGTTPYEFFQKTNQGTQEKAFGKIYFNRDERIIISGYGKYTNLDTALYTLTTAIPDGYTPDFEFGDDDNVKLITNKNISNYLPSNTGNGGDTTELDNRLKVLEAKQWEIHGRGMPNGVVTAPVGTTYVDEAVTNGALKWIKKTGTSNTGWEVLVGDTGWKIIPSVSKLGGSYVKVRRVNNIVSYQFGGLSWGWFGIVRRGGAGYQVQPSDRERNCFILGLNGVPTGYRSESSLKTLCQQTETLEIYE